MAVQAAVADQRIVVGVLVQYREGSSVVISVTSTSFKVTLLSVLAHVASILFAVAVDGRRSWGERFEFIGQVGLVVWIWDERFRSSHRNDERSFGGRRGTRV